MGAIRVALVAALSLQVSCLPSAKLTRWHRSADLTLANPAQTPTSTLGARLVALSIDPAATSRSTTSVTSLGDRGQAAWIESVSKLEGVDKTPQTLAQAVATPISGPTMRSSAIDRSVATRRLVISFDTRFLQPADRIARVDLKITPRELEHIAFAGWKQLATQYASIDLGEISSEQKNTFSLSDLLDVPQVDELAESGADLSFERKLAEKVALRSRLRAFSGALTPQRIDIVQEGAAGFDLQGNTVFEFSARVLPDFTMLRWVHDFVSLVKDDKPIAPKDVKIEDILVTYVPNPDALDLRLDLELSYVARLVTNEKGARTQVEGDDEVIFKREKVTTEAVVFEPSDYSISLWTITRQGQTVAIEVPRRVADKWEDLVFSSYEEAQTFLWWARETRPSSVAGRALRLSCTLVDPSRCPAPDFSQAFGIKAIQE
ncbi:MAG: hypothetical protein DWQ36_05305 [Acidobacteria bacterium]|nr:MAG: hypothetical protein DWQ30_12795 [Acidobacteriota bacterium]REK10059.1 MAG: hypothetical protein DWQ36_05305 [Acidobacteriota bacterium]